MVARRTDLEVDYTRGTDELANLIAAEIAAQGRNRRDVAAEAGVTRVALTDWLNGRRNLRAIDVIAVARVLGYELAMVPARPD